METETLNRKQITKLVNDFWKLHDQAQAAGKTDQANDYASQAFQLLSMLPENEIALSTPQ
jgi:hypothetical protein